jgi:hypothetical protein
MFEEDPRPYQLIQGDIHRCPKCGYEIVTGLAEQPFAVHYQADFDKVFSDTINNPYISVVYEYEK